MRRGLIARSPVELPDAVFDARLDRVRAAMREAKLDALAEAHLEEIAHLAPTLRTLWRQLEHATNGNTPHPAARRPKDHAEHLT